LRQLSSSQVSDWYLAQAMYYDGQSTRAEEILAALHGSAQAERRAQATRASFLAARGEREEARKLLQSVAAGTYLDHHIAYSMGVAYAQLGDFTEARRWLARSTETGFPCYPWFAHDPLLKTFARRRRLAVIPQSTARSVGREQEAVRTITEVRDEPSSRGGGENGSMGRGT